MSNTLLIAPRPSYSTTTSAPVYSAPSAPGLPDPLRSRQATLEPSQSLSASPHTTPLQSAHPLESRLRHWRATQQNLHMTLLRRQYGVAAPVMRAMELSDCAAGEAALSAGGLRAGWMGGDVHGDVLRGEDWEIGGWEGVYGGDDGFGSGGDFHAEMEVRGRMLW